VSTNVNTDQVTGVATRTAVGGSVRVNLLPEATKARDRAAQQRGVASAFGILLLLALGGTYWWLNGQVQDAESRLAAAQQQTAALQTEVAELASFADLAARHDLSMQQLQVAMAEEVSVAGLLQDFAAVVPSDTQLETLTVLLEPTPEAVEAGTFNASGKTLTSHAPGVERALLQLDKVASFQDLYLNSSALDDREGRVATFSLDGRVGVQSRTDRYADGLPEELR
jgi:Tfp pilus assembly protein PilN